MEIRVFTRIAYLESISHAPNANQRVLPVTKWTRGSIALQDVILRVH